MYTAAFQGMGEPRETGGGGNEMPRRKSEFLHQLDAKREDRKGKEATLPGKKSQDTRHPWSSQ